MSEDRKPLDSMSELMRKALEANPEMAENFKQIDVPFVNEYPLPIPNIMSKVENHLEESTKDFFLIYSRLLKAYASDTDSRFILDFLLHGTDLYEIFKNNKIRIINGLLLRGSQIRGIINQAEIDTETFMKIYGKSLEAWALSDTLELQYGGFMPVSVSKLLAEIQAEALE